MKYKKYYSRPKKLQQGGLATFSPNVNLGEAQLAARPGFDLQPLGQSSIVAPSAQPFQNTFSIENAARNTLLNERRFDLQKDEFEYQKIKDVRDYTQELTKSLLGSSAASSNNELGIDFRLTGAAEVYAAHQQRVNQLSQSALSKIQGGDQTGYLQDMQAMTKFDPQMQKYIQNSQMLASYEENFKKMQTSTSFANNELGLDDEAWSADYLKMLDMAKKGEHIPPEYMSKDYRIDFKTAAAKIDEAKKAFTDNASIQEFTSAYKGNPEYAALISKINTTTNKEEQARLIADLILTDRDTRLYAQKAGWYTEAINEDTGEVIADKEGLVETLTSQLAPLVAPIGESVESAQRAIALSEFISIGDDENGNPIKVSKNSPEGQAALREQAQYEANLEVETARRKEVNKKRVTDGAGVYQKGTVDGTSVVGNWQVPDSVISLLKDQDIAPEFASSILNDYIGMRAEGKSDNDIVEYLKSEYPDSIANNDEYQDIKGALEQAWKQGVYTGGQTETQPSSESQSNTELDTKALIESTGGKENSFYGSLLPSTDTAEEQPSMQQQTSSTTTSNTQPNQQPIVEESPLIESVPTVPRRDSQGLLGSDNLPTPPNLSSQSLEQAPTVPRRDSQGLLGSDNLPTPPNLSSQSLEQAPTVPRRDSVVVPSNSGGPSIQINTEGFSATTREVLSRPEPISPIELKQFASNVESPKELGALVLKAKEAIEVPSSIPGVGLKELPLNKLKDELPAELLNSKIVTISDNKSLSRLEELQTKLRNGGLNPQETSEYEDLSGRDLSPQTVVIPNGADAKEYIEKEVFVNPNKKNNNDPIINPNKVSNEKVVTNFNPRTSSKLPNRAVGNVINFQRVANRAGFSLDEDSKWGPSSQKAFNKLRDRVKKAGGRSYLEKMIPSGISRRFREKTIGQVDISENFFSEDELGYMKYLAMTEGGGLDTGGIGKDSDYSIMRINSGIDPNSQIHEAYSTENLMAQAKNKKARMYAAVGTTLGAHNYLMLPNGEVYVYDEHNYNELDPTKSPQENYDMRIALDEKRGRRNTPSAIAYSNNRADALRRQRQDQIDKPDWKVPIALIHLGNFNDIKNEYNTTLKKLYD